MVKNGSALVLTDAIFTLFLVHLTHWTDIKVVSELSLTAAWPFSHNFYVLIGICLLTIVFGVMSDSWSCFGRLGVVLIGIISCLLSGVFLLLDIPFMALVLLVYFSSAPVRNVFLLEQKGSQALDQVKQFVFRLSYTRLWVMFLWALLLENRVERTFHCFITASSLVFFVLYYLTFTTFIKDIYYEPTYKWINFKILTCFVCACFSNKKPVYYKKNEIVEGILQVKDQNRRKFEKGRMIRKCLYRCMRAVVPYVNVYVTKETNYLVKMDHCLLRSRPVCSEYVILQTLRFYWILPVMALSSVFSQLSNMILSFTASQSDMLRKTSLDFLDQLDLYTYFLLFQLLFFPLVEMMRSCVTKVLKKEIYLFFIGYGLLLVSYTVMLVLQTLIVPSLPYTPSVFTSQVRLFNANNQTIYVATTNEKVEHFIQAYDYKVISELPYGLNGQGWIKCNDKRIDVMFHLEQKETVSHVVKKCVLTKRNSTDPNLFTLTNNSFYGIFYLVTAEDIKGTLVLSNIAIPNTVSVNVSTGFDNFFMLPGSYNVTFQYEGNTTKHVKLPNSRFVEGALYCFFIWKEEQELMGKIIQVEGPLKYRYAYILPQVAILALGHAFATVSYFSALYVKSPEKLRATVFCIIMMMNILIYGISDNILPFYSHQYPYVVIIFGAVHLVIFTIAIAFASSLGRK